MILRRNIRAIHKSMLIGIKAEIIIPQKATSNRIANVFVDANIFAIGSNIAPTL